MRVITRGGHDWTHHFPAITNAARKLDVDTAILDGEAIVFDNKGYSDFWGVAALARRTRRQASPGGSGHFCLRSALFQRP